jgi:hypothetical protein
MGPFDFVSDPKEAHRMFTPGATWAQEAYVKDDPDRAAWQESAAAAIVDPVGCYRADHGHKNIKKMGIRPGDPAAVGTWTCLTSTNQVACQVDCQGMGYPDITPAILELQERCKAEGAPVMNTSALGVCATNNNLRSFVAFSLGCNMISSICLTK